MTNDDPGMAGFIWKLYFIGLAMYGWFLAAATYVCLQKEFPDMDVYALIGYSALAFFLSGLIVPVGICVVIALWSLSD